MKFKRVVIGLGETNGYVVYDENNLKTLIIDPGDEARTFVSYIDKNGLTPVGIILTHYHHDHIGAVEELKTKYNCPVCIHKKDVEGLKNPNINHSVRGPRKPISIIPDRLLTDGDIIQAGEVTLEVIHTPGHTPGGICLRVKDDNIIFTGDTIFKDDIGRMDLEGGSEASMHRTIVNKIAKWEDHMVLYPGHGESAAMEHVRRKNGEFIYMNKK